MVTVVVRKSGDEYHRGVAICSPLDQIVKTRGVEIATKNSIAAEKRWPYLYNESFKPIQREEVVEFLETLDADYDLIANLIGHGKSTTLNFDQLNSFEQKVFGQRAKFWAKNICMNENLLKTEKVCGCLGASAQ